MSTLETCFFESIQHLRNMFQAVVCTLASSAITAVLCWIAAGRKWQLVRSLFWASWEYFGTFGTLFIPKLFQESSIRETIPILNKQSLKDERFIYGNIPGLWCFESFRKGVLCDQPLSRLFGEVQAGRDAL